MNKRAGAKIANSPVVRAVPGGVEDPSSSPFANVGFTPWCAASHESVLSADLYLTLTTIPSCAEPTFPRELGGNQHFSHPRVLIQWNASIHFLLKDSLLPYQLMILLLYLL